MWFLGVFFYMNSVSGSPSPLRPCRSCAGVFFSWKNTPLDFWSMYFVDVLDLCRFQGPPLAQTTRNPGYPCPTQAVSWYQLRLYRTHMKNGFPFPQFNIFVCVVDFHRCYPPWYFFQNMCNLFKWLCQQDAHRNSVEKDVLHCSTSFPKD